MADREATSDRAGRSHSNAKESNGTAPGLALTVPPELVEAIARRTAELLAGQFDQSEPSLPADPSRLTLTKAEAAESLGVSVDHLERHVLPELRVVRSGRLRLIPFAELQRWIDAHAGRALEGR